MKKFAFINYGGQVMSIETRCACKYSKDKKAGELAVDEIIAPNLVEYFVEIPSGVTVTEGMLYSNGVFKENPIAPTAKVAELENRVSSTEDAVLALMMK